MNRCRNNSHIGVGVVVILVGLFLLLDNLNVVPHWLNYYLFAWQNILIAIGIISLIAKPNKVPGLVLIAIGLAFWSPQFFHNAHEFIIPVGIILVGILILARRNIRAHSEGRQPVIDRGDPDSMDIVAIFSGGERIVTSKHFKGGKITAIFGGAEVNMLNAGLSPNAVIDILVIFGGASIIVPHDWEVIVEIQPIFGGFSDSRHVSSDQPVNPEKRLFIKGLALFGGGEIKSYK